MIYQQRIKVICVFFIVSVCLIEVLLRLVGFCNAPLYCNDSYTGYRLVANQNIHRFGNNFKTNEFCMRSDELKDNEHRILLVGDSVLNGGIQTDQGNLASQMLDEKYRKHYEGVRVLNISCGGWGIDNAMGMFEEYGDFDGKAIVLVFNSHDARGTISTIPVAGNSKGFPDKQYSIAWIELFDRYLLPKVASKLPFFHGKEIINTINTSEGNTHSKGWDFFRNLAEKKRIPLVIYLHADRSEMDNGSYDENGQWIIEYARKHNIKIITDIGVLQESDYRDDIHLSKKGQHIIYELLVPVLEEHLEKMRGDQL